MPQTPKPRIMPEDPSNPVTHPPAGRRRVPFLVWGWAIALGIAAGVAVPAWHLLVEGKLRVNVVGDGEHIESYGFDLSNLAVDRGLVEPVNGPKDRFESLVMPKAVSADEVRELNRKRYGKWLVNTDRVIGVIVGDEARAYPIRVMNWHAIANDRLGGQPIAVTYSGEADATVVFARQVGQHMPEFGYSGLIYNGHMLMYDRQPDPETESLWSQMAMRAVSGPLKGAELKSLPFSVTSWGHWKEAHPATTVVLGDPKLDEKYKQNPYVWWEKHDKPPYAVAALPPSDGEYEMLDRVVAIQSGGQWEVHRLDDLAALETAGLTLTPTRVERVAPGFLLSMPQGAAAPEATVSCFWYAWHAMEKAPRQGGEE